MYHFEGDVLDEVHGSPSTNIHRIWGPILRRNLYGGFLHAAALCR